MQMIFTFIFYAVSWISFSQPMEQIDTGISPYVWATDANQTVFLLNEEQRKFEEIPGMNLVHVTSGEAGVNLSNVYLFSSKNI